MYHQYFNLPNLISSIRLLITLPTCYLILQENWNGALILWTIAVCSDVLDGVLARRLNINTRVGTFLDHGADAVFVISCMATLASQGILTVLLAPLAALAFIRYVLNRHVSRGGAPKSSWLGKLNGVSYYLLCGLAIVQSGLGKHLLDEQIPLIVSWMLVATTAALIIREFNRH